EERCEEDEVGNVGHERPGEAAQRTEHEATQVPRVCARPREEGEHVVEVEESQSENRQSGDPAHEAAQAARDLLRADELERVDLERLDATPEAPVQQQVDAPNQPQCYDDGDDQRDGGDERTESALQQSFGCTSGAIVLDGSNDAEAVGIRES